MKADRFVRFLLLVIAVCVATIDLHSFVVPRTALAQSTESQPFYIEPGTTMLRVPGR